MLGIKRGESRYIDFKCNLNIIARYRNGTSFDILQNFVYRVFNNGT